MPLGALRRKELPSTPDTLTIHYRRERASAPRHARGYHAPEFRQPISTAVAQAESSLVVKAEAELRAAKQLIHQDMEANCRDGARRLAEAARIAGDLAWSVEALKLRRDTVLACMDAARLMIGSADCNAATEACLNAAWQLVDSNESLGLRRALVQRHLDYIASVVGSRAVIDAHEGRRLLDPLLPKAGTQRDSVVDRLVECCMDLVCAEDSPPGLIADRAALATIIARSAPERALDIAQTLIGAMQGAGHADSLTPDDCRNLDTLHRASRTCIRLGSDDTARARAMLMFLGATCFLFASKWPRPSDIYGKAMTLIEMAVLEDEEPASSLAARRRTVDVLHHCYVQAVEHSGMRDRIDRVCSRVQADLEKCDEPFEIPGDRLTRDDPWPHQADSRASSLRSTNFSASLP